MQEIGEEVFWNIKDDRIDEESIYEGIKSAATSLRNKTLKYSLNNIKNPFYKSILLKLGENEQINFTKKEILILLNDNEKRVYNNFLGDMIKLGILEETNPDIMEYSFVTPIYFIYFLIISTFGIDI